MRLKTVLIFVSVIAIGIFNNLPSKALEPTETTSEKYLLDHGHSPEIVRMINLQKERTEGKVTEASKSQNQVKKFLKNLWFEQDLTMPTTDFGYRKVNSVETDKSAAPSVIKSIKSQYDQYRKDKKESKEQNEVNINDVKVRETK
jgi:hypothetical protein